VPTVLTEEKLEAISAGLETSPRKTLQRLAQEMLTEEKLDAICARLETSSRKTLQRLAQETLTEEKLDAIWARLETSPRKTLQRLAQETIFPKASAGRTTKMATIATIKSNISRGFEGTLSGFKNSLLKN
jgi:predicted DNA-binding transcriptional regulator YafY